MVVVPAAAVRVRALVAGGCGLANGRRAAAAAARTAAGHEKYLLSWKRTRTT